MSDVIYSTDVPAELIFLDPFLVENVSDRLNQHTVRGSVILTLVFHIYYAPFDPLLPPSLSLSQLSVIEASPAWDGSCGVHHRGARLQRPFP